MTRRLFRLASFCIFWQFCALLAAGANLRFQVSFPASVHTGPITGRVFVALAKKATPEPIDQAGFWSGQTPFFGVDVDRLVPGSPAVVDSQVLGYPANSLADVPAGDYYVQALINVYTEFHRSDGHVIWAHMDQWEGQQFNRSPGNLKSEARRIHIDPAAGYDISWNLPKSLILLRLPQIPLG